jgi:hypothetical protein
MFSTHASVVVSEVCSDGKQCCKHHPQSNFDTLFEHHASNIFELPEHYTYMFKGSTWASYLENF